MKSRRLAPESGLSLVVVSALLGVILGSAASLYVQRSPGPQAPCPVCPACNAAVEPRSGGALAVAHLGALPVGGTWTPAGRESMGNAELQKVLERVAVNNEVLVAGALRFAWRKGHSTVG